MRRTSVWSASLAPVSGMGTPVKGPVAGSSDVLGDKLNNLGPPDNGVSH